MRLIFDSLPNAFNIVSLVDFYEVASLRYRSALYEQLTCMDEGIVEQSMELFNCFNSQILDLGEVIWSLATSCDSAMLLAVLDQFCARQALTAELVGDLHLQNLFTWVALTFGLDTSLLFLMTTIYLSTLYLRYLVDNMSYGESSRAHWHAFFDLYIFSWAYGGESKMESTEELLCLLVLWPWCVFIIASHLMGATNHSVIFGFAEWGLPVTYGLLLLLEHLWTFGIYIFVYLVGIRGRKSFILTMIEDFVAMLIMVVRVLLQSIRGVIVGMFHFICREALLNMTKWWSIDFKFNHQLGLACTDDSFSLDLIAVLTDFALAAGSLVVVTAIMFLQLIFLIVSVWLFCKCWFISWSVGMMTVQPKGIFGAGMNVEAAAQDEF